MIMNWFEFEERFRQDEGWYSERFWLLISDWKRVWLGVLLVYNFNMGRFRGRFKIRDYEKLSSEALEVELVIRGRGVGVSVVWYVCVKLCRGRYSRVREYLFGFCLLKVARADYIGVRNV